MPECLLVRPSIYLAIDTTNGAAVNFPFVYQIDSSETADWLMITPGLFNNGGTKGDYEIDVIAGSPAPAATAGPIASGAAAYPTSALAVNPVVTIPSGQQGLVPWGKRLQFAILVRSTSANIPAAGSRLSLTIIPFNT